MAVIRGVLLASLCVVPSVAQGSKHDYERMRSFRSTYGPLLEELSIRPTWLDDGSLWYLEPSARGEPQLVVVDVRSQKRLTIDEKRLREALDSPAAPLRVVRLARVTDTVFDVLLRGGDAVRIDTEGDTTPIDAFAIEAWRNAPASQANRQETAVALRNDLKGTLQLDWVRPNGKLESYGELAPGEVRWQHTFAGHRWRLVDEQGSTVGEFEAKSLPIVLPLSEAWLKAEREADPRRQRAKPTNRNIGSAPPLVVLDGALTLGGTVLASPVEKSRYDSPLQSEDGRVAFAFRRTQATPRRIHLIDAVPDDPTQGELDSVRYAKPGDPYDTYEAFLFSVDDKGAAPRRVAVDNSLFASPKGLSRLRWNESTRSVQFVFLDENHQLQRWIAIDGRTGEARVLAQNESDTFLDYSQKTYAHELEDGKRGLWMSERSGFNHLELVDLVKGGVIRSLTSGKWNVRGVERVDEARGRVLIRALGLFPEQDPYHVHFAWVDLATGELTHLTRSDGTHGLEFSPDGSAYIDRWSRVDQAPVAELRRSLDGSLVIELGRTDESRLVEANWPRPERFVAKGRDGSTDIYGVVYRPSNFDPTQSYPVVEKIYAGPHDYHVPKAFRVATQAQEIAELGFVVVQIDGMGTNWRSKAFHDVCWRNLKDAGLPDRVAWIRALKAAEPAIDLDRVGIFGGSAGGQNALAALLFHGDFYSVAVADCGCHDNRVDKRWWNEAWMGRPIGPWYADNANATHAGRLEGELLLIVGALDRNVDPVSTLQVVQALVEADKDFDLLVLPKAGHGAAETPYGSRRRADFLVRHLHGVEPRWE